MGEDELADDVDWDVCTEDGCIGVRVPTGERCWAHAADNDLDAALKHIGEDGSIDARGVPITTDLLERILRAAPHDEHGVALLARVDFRLATFQDDVGFAGANIQGNAWFNGATFDGGAEFMYARFQGDAEFEGTTFCAGGWFTGAVFQGDAWFGRTNFRGIAQFSDATFKDSARFTQSTFERGAWFTDVSFPDGTFFNGVAFHGETRFDDATFQGRTEFTGADFRKRVLFNDATFHGRAEFADATFHSESAFALATFKNYAGFGEATFGGEAQFPGVTFGGSARFDRATFGGIARFELAMFRSDTRFEEATFRRDADFSRATFERTRRLGPVLASRRLVLDDAVFHQPVLIEVTAATLCCQRTRFLAGVQLRIRWAQVVMDDADLAAPSIVAGVPGFENLDEGRWAHAMRRLQAADTRGDRPRLVSLRRADVAGLTVADVDLRACRFTGAHHLSHLCIRDTSFDSPPRTWRWTRRQTLAEEHHWRAVQDADRQHTTPAVAARTSGTGGWYRRAQRPPGWLDVELLDPRHIAALYRSLRKGREDIKDEPGAADFYYGEMEMRRHDRTAPRGERFILTLYWLFSGYALRASRALTWLFCILAVAATVLALVGLDQPNPAADWSFPARLGTAALVAVEGAAFRTAEQELTYTGRLIQVVLRLAGPLLLGLAALSIRGRVKR